MPNTKNTFTSRRTLSKVELELKRERDEEEKRLKKEKHMRWMYHQSKKNKQYHLLLQEQTVKKEVVVAKKEVKTSPSKSVVVDDLKHSERTNKTEKKVVVFSCINSSWADQMEFEDFLKKRLMRMGFVCILGIR